MFPASSSSLRSASFFVWAPITPLSLRCPVLFLATPPLVSSVHPTPNITQVLLSKQKLYLSPSKSSQWLPFYQGTKSERCMLIQHARGLAAVFSSLFTEDRFVVVVVVQTCMGSFTPVVRLCFLSFFILFFFRLEKKKNVNASPQTHLRYGGPPSHISWLFPLYHEAVDTPLTQNTGHARCATAVH